ncbi:MAG: SRPBCC family protein [Solirubrobacterales bacterium]
MRVDESIEIASPRRRVWELVSQPQRYTEFMVGSAWEAIPGEPTSRLRARFRLKVRVGSTDLGAVVEVVEFDPPHELAWTSVRGIDNRGRWILRERGEETEVTMRLSYQVPGGLLALIASRLGAPLLRRSVRESLRALKETLEQEEPAGRPASGTRRAED